MRRGGDGSNNKPSRSWASRFASALLEALAGGTRLWGEFSEVAISAGFTKPELKLLRRWVAQKQSAVKEMQAIAQRGQGFTKGPLELRR
jgi:hypothetical protein